MAAAKQADAVMETILRLNDPDYREKTEQSDHDEP